MTLRMLQFIKPENYKSSMDILFPAAKGINTTIYRIVNAQEICKSLVELSHYPHFAEPIVALPASLWERQLKVTGGVSRICLLHLSSVY